MTCPIPLCTILADPQRILAPRIPTVKEIIEGYKLMNNNELNDSTTSENSLRHAYRVANY